MVNTASDQSVVNIDLIKNLTDNFSQRLLKNGYSQASVSIGVHKVGALMKHSLISGHAALKQRCDYCHISKEYGTGMVYGYGNPSSPIMFIGEGPGEHEDMFNLPFTGIAGAALTMWLEKMPLRREQVYITNVLKCRPLNNRTPSTDECTTCIKRYLEEEIRMVNPKIIVAVGGVALNALLPGKNLKITQIRGLLCSYWQNNIEYNVMPIYHPAYVLRKTGADFTTVNIDVYNDLLLAYSKL